MWSEWMSLCSSNSVDSTSCSEAIRRPDLNYSWTAGVCFRPWMRNYVVLPDCRLRFTQAGIENKKKRHITVKSLHRSFNPPELPASPHPSMQPTDKGSDMARAVR